MVSELYLKPTALTETVAAMPAVSAVFASAKINKDSPFIHTGMTQSLTNDSVWDKGIFVMYKQTHQLPSMDTQVVCLDENEEPVYASVIDPYAVYLYLKEVRKVNLRQLSREDLQSFLKVRRMLEMASTFHYQIWIY